ncbi:MAG: STAS domain-containing protein [Spirochaetes bacterium]|nr:STAS domain-containing protein [Spirochaetota bacterium]
MTIEFRQISETSIELSLVGRLDAITSPMLEKKLKKWVADATDITLDFLNLNYISSMGLRVLLHAQKKMKEQNRKLVIKNMGDGVREIFEITGFINIMTIE